MALLGNSNAPRCQGELRRKVPMGCYWCSFAATAPNALRAAPSRLDVKAPAGAPNVLIIPSDDMGFPLSRHVPAKVAVPSKPAISGLASGSLANDGGGQRLGVCLGCCRPRVVVSSSSCWS